jgi:hypothetical protein
MAGEVVLDLLPRSVRVRKNTDSLVFPRPFAGQDCELGDK